MVEVVSFEGKEVAKDSNLEHKLQSLEQNIKRLSDLNRRLYNLHNKLGNDYFGSDRTEHEGSDKLFEVFNQQLTNFNDELIDLEQIVTRLEEKL